MSHSKQPKTKLAGNIARLRRKAGLRQKDLAEKLQIDTKRLGAWEEGRAKPNADFLQMMAAVFETTIEDILNGDDAPEGQN